MWAAGAVATVLGGWQTRQTRQIGELRRRVTEQEQKINALTSWQTRARQYIGQLLFVMALHGVSPPTPPASLGLNVDDNADGNADDEAGSGSDSEV